MAILCIQLYYRFKRGDGVMKNNKLIIKKKSYLFFLIMLIIMVFLIGCKNNDFSNESIENKDELKIVSTIFPYYDFTKQIVGDKGNVSMLIPPGAESHSYEPSPQDIIKIQNCDLFIFTGGESDKWIEGVLSSIDTSNKKIIRIMDCVETVKEEPLKGAETELEHKHEHEDEYDEHVWTSPEKAIDISKEISNAICERDPNNSQYYKENTDIYLKQLERISSEFKNIVDQGKRKTIIFGDRFPFRYFVEDYGLDYYAAFPGCSSETEPSVSTITFLTDLVKKEKIPVVFYIESSNHKIADMICEATGAKALPFNSCHNLSNEEMESGKTYVEIMQKNAENLREALQ